MYIDKKTIDDNDADNKDPETASSSDESITFVETNAFNTENSNLLGLECEKKIEYGEIFSLTDKKNVDYTGEGIESGVEQEIKFKTDNSSVTMKSGLDVSAAGLLDNEKDNESVELKYAETVAVQRGIVENERKQEAKASYDGKHFTVGYGEDYGIKAGNDQIYKKVEGGYSTKFGLDRTSVQGHYGQETKFGPIEYGSKHTTELSNSIEENEHGETAETEVLKQNSEKHFALDFGYGVKYKESVEVEKSDKISQSENYDIAETEIGGVKKKRIEIDGTKVGNEAAIIAGVYNTGQYIKETVQKDASTINVSVECSKESSAEDEAYIEDQSEQALENAKHPSDVGEEYENDSKVVDDYNKDEVESEDESNDVEQSFDNYYDYGYGY